MFRVALMTIAMLSTTAFAADRLYKWVDEHGRVQYSDKPPLQPAQKGITEINRRGMVVGQTEGMLTQEQKAARDAELAKEKAEERKLADQRRRDKALMESFNNVREIDAMRDGKLEQAKASMQTDLQRIENTNRRLDGYQKQVEARESRKKKVPDDLLADIAATKEELSRLNKIIEQRKLDMQQIRERAEADKVRLIELKGDVAK